jgi:hypothetical protein
MTSATLTAVALLTPTPEPSPAVTVTVTPTLPSPDERVLMQELIDIRAELRQAKSDTFLLLAASHLSDAEDALRVNNLAEVERLLVTVRVALDRAYEYAEVYKNPIDDFRVQVGQMREDLRVYPEGMDQQLRRLRQNILSIVSEDD